MKKIKVILKAMAAAALTAVVVCSCANPNAGDDTSSPTATDPYADKIVVGSTDCSSGWWTAFSSTIEVPVNESRTFKFTNYGDGDANWHNFLAVLTTTSTNPTDSAYSSSDEICVVRADNYGWGTGYSTATLTSNWDWDNFYAITNGAEVTAVVTNNNGTVDVAFTVVPGSAYTGTTESFYQNYAGITSTADASVYVTFTTENGFLVFDKEVEDAE